MIYPHNALACLCGEFAVNLFLEGNQRRFPCFVVNLLWANRRCCFGKWVSSIVLSIPKPPSGGASKMREGRGAVELHVFHWLGHHMQLWWRLRKAAITIPRMQLVLMLHPHQTPHQLPSSWGKKAYKPLNISYTVARGGNAGPALGTAAPSSLADVLRQKRSQQVQRFTDAGKPSEFAWIWGELFHGTFAGGNHRDNHI